jgi:hypothetical protein
MVTVLLLLNGKFTRMEGDVPRIKLNIKKKFSDERNGVVFSSASFL